MIRPRLPHSDSYARCTAAVREWLSVHDLSSLHGKATEDECHEADAQLDAVLRRETNLGLNQAIERIDAADWGVFISLDDGTQFMIDADTGFFTDRTNG
jgi:hypothetical protein